MKNLKLRVISTVIMVVIGLGIIFMPDKWYGDWFFTALCIIMNLLVAYEISNAAKVFKIKFFPVLAPLFTAAAAMPFLAHFFLQNFEDGKLYFFAIFGISFALLSFISLALSIFGKDPMALSDICAAFVGIFYITTCTSMLSMIRMSEHGIISIFLIIMASSVPDMGAYFIGVRFGKHKMIPKISPKKSFEGLAGGFVFGIIILMLYGIVIDLFFNDLRVDYLHLFILCIVLIITGVMGDLVASIFKRKYNVKDYSNFLPGHGGFFDRFDSTFAVGLVTYLLTIGTGLLHIYK